MPGASSSIRNAGIGVLDKGDGLNLTGDHDRTSDVLTGEYVLEYAYKRTTGPTIGAFLTGLRDGRLLGARTADGRVISPPTEYDPQTGDPTGELVEVGPGGEVTTWAWVDAPRPNHPLGHPFAWALVKLDGADTAMLHAVDAGSAERMRSGMRVTPRWNDIRVGHVLDLHFVPEEDGAQAATHMPAGEPVTRFKSPMRLDYDITASAELSHFLRGLMDRRILGARDPETGNVYVPAPSVIPTNGMTPSETDIEVAHTGTVTTFCVINIPFEGQVLTPPYVGASILLDGADVPIFHLVGGVDPEQVRMGLRVRALWEEEPIPSLATIRYFEPTGEPDAPMSTFEKHL